VFRLRGVFHWVLPRVHDKANLQRRLSVKTHLSLWTRSLPQPIVGLHRLSDASVASLR
jgi:hypothetical protein